VVCLTFKATGVTEHPTAEWTGQLVIEHRSGTRLTVHPSTATICHNHIHHPPQQDRHRRKSLAAVLVPIFLLVLFELTVVAYVYRLRMEPSHVLVELGRKISGADPKIGDVLIVTSDLADSARLRSLLARKFKSSDSNTRCDAYSPDHAKHCVPTTYDPYGARFRTNHAVIDSAAHANVQLLGPAKADNEATISRRLPRRTGNHLSRGLAILATA
jgi:hypothetical protein